MAENNKNRLTRMLLSKSRRAQYLRIFAVLAACVVVAVVVILHQNGIAMTHEEQVLTCPVTGTVAHAHDQSCYDKDGNLVCTLPEVELHVHDDSCYTETRELTCEQEESDEHKHTDECYTVTRELTCGKEEVTEAHEHGPGCFTTVVVEDEEPEATEQAEASMPAQNFTGKVEDQDGKTILQVEVEAPEGAFPANTTMKIEALNSDDVKQAVDEAVAQKAADAKVTDIQAVDIKFFNEAGEEIEPAKDITVRFISDQIAKNKKSYVVHVNDDGKGDVVDSLTDEQLAERNQKAADDELLIDANKFSPYVLVGTKELTTDVLMEDGKEYTVTVSYDDEANIPEGAKLSVAPFKEDSPEYVAAREAWVADIVAKGEDVDPDALGFAALDISILDADGNKVEPATAVTVDIKIKELPGVDDLNEVKDTIVVQHQEQTNDGIEVETVLEGNTEGSFEVASFSTFTITWTSNNNQNREVTVHYVEKDNYDTNGQPHELNIDLNGQTQLNLDNNSHTPAYLIYDIDGYEYDYTYLENDNVQTNIKPYLTKGKINNRGRNVWKYQTTNSTTETELPNNADIYVVYTPKAAYTQGGTPKITNEEGTWPEDTPQFSKASKNNGDGTNTISLDISAKEIEHAQSTKADVIVIFDKSESMVYRIGSNAYPGRNEQSRLDLAKEATNTMAGSLLSKQGVRMALITFGTDAKLAQGFTTNAGEITSALNTETSTLSGERTNWEKALRIANQLEVDPDATTYVIFVTDGDPTVRVSRGHTSQAQYTNSELDTLGMNDSYYRNLQHPLFGNGQYSQENNVNACYNPSVPEVASIVGNKKNFYAIGVSNQVNRLTQLMQDANAPTDDHLYLCTEVDALNAAFNSITSSVKSTLGFGDVEIIDGITELTHTEMEVMETVDPSSFKYYRWGGENNKYGNGSDIGHMTEWTTRAADGCNAASYDKETNKVSWNMGDGFQLENDVHYVVTFRAWPSQAAYDLIADLNNGVKSYNSISEEERKQINEEYAPQNGNPGFYQLKTNTDEVSATYKKTSKSGSVVSISTDNQTYPADKHETTEPINLESMKLTVKKVFEDDLTYDASKHKGEDQPESVTLTMKRRDSYLQEQNSKYYSKKNTDGFTDYAVSQNGGALSPTITLSDANEWTFTYYISPGFKNGNDVLEHGYDFTVIEPGIDYHYELFTEIVNPMVVDGTGKYFVVDENTGEYVGEGQTEKTLLAKNRVKSGIDVKKIVLDENGHEIYPNTEFTITGQLLGPDGQPYTFANSQWTRTDQSTANGASSDWVAHQNDTGAYHKYDKDGNRTIYKGHFDSTGNISFTLKAGEYIRFINVPEGCTFTFTEELSDGVYGLESLDAKVSHREPEGGAFVDESDEHLSANKDTKTASLVSPGVAGDKQYAVTFTNKRLVPPPTIELEKVDSEDTSKKLNDFEFELYKDAEKKDQITTNANGDSLNLKTGNKPGSAEDAEDGWMSLETLDPGTYYLFEKEHVGYLPVSDPIVITIALKSDKSGYDVNAVLGTSDQATQLDVASNNGVYTITMPNERAIEKVRIRKVNADLSAGLEDAEFRLTGNGVDINLKSDENGFMYENIEGAQKPYEYDFELGISNEPYTLVEEKAPGGYYKLADEVKIFVHQDNVEMMIGDTVYEVIMPTQDANYYTIRIPNSDGSELPATGGIGTAAIYAAGAALVGIAGFGLVSKKMRNNL